MGLFSNLFGKKQDNEDNGLVLNLVNNGFVINDTRFQFPVRASELIKVLGTPRVVERACDDMLKKIYCEKYGFDINTYQPLNYYWDEFGLLACTHDHETVLSNNRQKSNPKNQISILWRNTGIIILEIRMTACL